MLTAAKERRPVNALSRSGLRISTGDLDESGSGGDAVCCRWIPSGLDLGSVPQGLKPLLNIAPLSARLKSCPFKASRRYEGADLFAHDYALDVAGVVHVEDDHGEIVVFAEADGGQVHHLESLLEDLHV